MSGKAELGMVQRFLIVAKAHGLYAEKEDLVKEISKASRRWKMKPPLRRSQISKWIELEHKPSNHHQNLLWKFLKEKLESQNSQFKDRWVSCSDLGPFIDEFGNRLESLEPFLDVFPYAKALTDFEFEHLGIIRRKITEARKSDPHMSRKLKRFVGVYRFFRKHSTDINLCCERLEIKQNQRLGVDVTLTDINGKSLEGNAICNGKGDLFAALFCAHEIFNFEMSYLIVNPGGFPQTDRFTGLFVGLTDHSAFPCAGCFLLERVPSDENLEICKIEPEDPNYGRIADAVDNAAYLKNLLTVTNDEMLARLREGTLGS